MKKLFRFKKEFILFLLVVILASFLRLYNLGTVPVSMTDDEIRETYTAYSIAHTGRDVFGNFLPVVFKIDGASTWGPVLMYIKIPFSLFLPLNSFTARFPYALASIFSVIFFYFIVKKLFNDKIAIVSSFALSVSVWQIQLARIVIESNISLTLYLLGIFVYLYSKNKTRLIVLSMVVFFLAFFSYSAFKIFFLPLILILVWYKFKELGKKHLLIILTTILLTFGSYGFLIITQNAAYYTGNEGSSLFFQDKQRTALSVEMERRASNEPQIIKTLYHNKFTFWFRVFATNYLTGFSPQYLFLNQEASGIYSIWGRGELYIFELPLILIGIVYLFLKKRKEFYLVLMLLLISSLPSALGVGIPTWTSRSAFMVFWLYVFVGAGIFCLLTLPKKQIYKYVIFAIISLFYLYGVMGYIFQYYYDWSRTNAKYFSESTKDLIYKIGDYQKEGKNVFVSGATQNTFLHYAFYNKVDPKIVQENISKIPIKFSNFTLQEECLKEIPKNLVYITVVNCRYNATPSAMIKEPNSSVTVWNIYEN